MSENKIALYDAFGELLYVLAKADGEIQKEEVQELEKILKAHPWSKEIIWSFNYEAKKENDLEELYQKVLHACFDLGPNPEYQFMVEVLEAVAESSIGVVEEERALIDRFQKDLVEEFKKRP